MSGSLLRLLHPEYRGGTPNEKPRGRLELDPGGLIPNAQIALAMNEGHGRFLYDASRFNNHFAIDVSTGEDAGWARTTNGVGFSVNTACSTSEKCHASNINFPSLASAEANRSFSLSIKFTPLVEESGRSHFQWGSEEDADGSPWILMRQGTATNRLRVWVNSAYRIDIDNVIYAGVPLTIGLRYDHVADEWEAFADGISQGTYSTANTGASPGQIILIGNGFNGSELTQFDNFFVEKDKAWPDNTFLELYRNPWQVFKTRSIWPPAGAAAAGPIEATFTQGVGKNIAQTSIFTGFGAFSQTQGNSISEAADISTEAALSQGVGKSITETVSSIVEPAFSQTQGNTISEIANSIVEPAFSQTQGNNIAEVADISTEAVLSQGIGKNITETVSSIVEPTFTQGVGKNISETAVYIGYSAFSQTQGMNISQLGELVLDAALTQGLGKNITQAADITIEATVPLNVGKNIAQTVVGTMGASFTQGLGKNITEIAVKITADSFAATCGLTLVPTATIETAVIAGAIGIDVGASISQIAITDVNANITLAEANSIAETTIATIEGVLSQTLGIAVDQAFSTYALITPFTRHIMIAYRDQKIGITYELRNTGILDEIRSIDILK